MSTIHFLNVKNGDCSWIKHNSGHITVIDVNNAKKIEVLKEFSESVRNADLNNVKGNFNQKKHPVNPIEYLNSFGVDSIFRFILTHPDMDHMGGIKDFFESFDITNFWDTNNNKEIENFGTNIYSKDDWEFYTKLRGEKVSDITRLALYSGAKGQYYNRDKNGNPGGDGLNVLAPTEALIQEANEKKEYNDCSYVILYISNGRKILFAGDSDDKSWNHILENHSNDVKDIDILIAPHHGRDSGRSYDFLDILKPKMTYFGNADSEYLAYDPWLNRGLKKITNNQANCIISDITTDGTINIYCTYENFAKSYNSMTVYNNNLKAWFLTSI